MPRSAQSGVNQINHASNHRQHRAVPVELGLASASTCMKRHTIPNPHERFSLPLPCNPPPHPRTLHASSCPREHFDCIALSYLFRSSHTNRTRENTKSTQRRSLCILLDNPAFQLRPCKAIMHIEIIPPLPAPSPCSESSSASESPQRVQKTCAWRVS